MTVFSHSVVSLVPSATIYYANGQHSPYGYVYLGSWIGGLVGLGGGALLAWALPSRDPTGFGKLFIAFLGYCAGSFIGANVGYRSSEYPAASEQDMSKMNLSAISFQAGF